MKKKLKGMTLVECIVALAVMAVFTSGMAAGIGAVCKLKVTSDYVIKQNSLQAPLADNRVGGVDSVDPVTVSVTATGISYVGNYDAKKHTINYIDTGEDTSGNNLISNKDRRFKYYNDYVKTP